MEDDDEPAPMVQHLKHKKKSGNLEALAQHGSSSQQPSTRKAPPPELGAVKPTRSTPSESRDLLALTSSLQRTTVQGETPRTLATPLSIKGPRVSAPHMESRSFEQGAAVRSTVTLEETPIIVRQSSMPSMSRGRSFDFERRGQANEVAGSAQLPRPSSTSTGRVGKRRKVHLIDDPLIDRPSETAVASLPVTQQDTVLSLRVIQPNTAKSQSSEAAKREPVVEQRAVKKQKSVSWTDPESWPVYTESGRGSGTAVDAEAPLGADEESQPSIDSTFKSRRSASKERRKLWQDHEEVMNKDLWKSMQTQLALTKQTQERIDRMHDECIPMFDEAGEKARLRRNALDEETCEYAAELELTRQRLDNVESDEEDELLSWQREIEALVQAEFEADIVTENSDLLTAAFEERMPTGPRSVSRHACREADDVMQQSGEIAKDHDGESDRHGNAAHEDAYSYDGMQLEEDDEARGQKDADDAAIKDEPTATPELSSSVRNTVDVTTANTPIRRGRGGLLRGARSNLQKSQPPFPIVVRRNNSWVNSTALPAVVVDQIKAHYTALHTGRRKDDWGRYARRQDVSGKYCVQCEVIVHDRGKCPMQECQAYTACDKCVKNSRPCAILVEVEGNYKLGWLPLPEESRGGVSWDELGYWIRQ